MNVESLAGRYAPSSDFVSDRRLAIQTDPLLLLAMVRLRRDDGDTIQRRSKLELVPIYE